MNRANRDPTSAPSPSGPLQGNSRLVDTASPDDRRNDLILGLAVCSLLPALFWCGVIWLAAPFVGLHPTPLGLAAIGSTIALFLTLISGAVLARH